MRVWVNVWGSLALLGPLLVGCIDDFDDPHGYGPSDGTSDTFGDRRLSCSDLCEESARCGTGDIEDCRDQCNQLTEISRRAGCTDDLEDVLDCLAAGTSVCTQQDRCESVTFDFSNCIERYCGTRYDECDF